MPSLDSSITTHAGCTVVPLITGPNYFPALKAKIDALGSGDTSGQFIYIAGWWLDPNFSLGGGTRLTDLLIAKARAGVDVRVLGWVLAPEVLQNRQAQGAPQLGSILQLNGETMDFINALRTEPSLANKACLNILAHPAGAVHMKMALVGTNSEVTGFTGGLDFQRGRHDSTWHDVQAQITGPAVQEMFDAYRQMWNEIRGRTVVQLTASGTTADSHSSSMPDLPSRSLSSGGGGSARVQSVRTVPRMRFSSAGLLPSLAGARIPTNQPLSFASNGLFEVRTAWSAGIQGALDYIYIEDQGFSSQEVFDWINDAVRASSTVRVVVLGGQVDPNDTPNSATEKFFRIAVNDHLIRGLNSSQIDQIGLFSHQTKVIHTKSTIVDDQWAIIGSANSMRRSLFTDMEHSLAIMEAGTVVSYRADLWGVHLQRSISDVSAALDEWFAIPFQGSGAAPLDIVRVRLPLPAASLTAEEQVIYDEVMDVDSRNEWGGRLIDFYMSQYGLGSLSP